MIERTELDHQTIMQPKPPLQVKLFSGVLYSDPDALNRAFSLLEEKYGPIEYRSQDFPFTETDYYNIEMGTPIYRHFISFKNLIIPNQIAKIKLECNTIEERVASQQGRVVNLDPGYMDYDKVVLASAKYNGNKVYLDEGIWADLTLRFEQGQYLTYPWSFPDFKTGQYQEVFLEIRRLYKTQMRRLFRKERQEIQANGS